jgi:hypothetical protein
MNRIAQFAFPVLLLAPAGAMGNLFFDNFNTAASASNYNRVDFNNNDVIFGWDYSLMGIPVAPGTTDGSTRGVRFASNMTAPGAAAAVTLHTLQSFSGNYIVRFDMWINANGPFPAGGTGSTEFVTAGIGGDGTTVNRTGATGSGGWTGVDGEGGSGIDYRLFRGSALEGVANGAYAAGTTTDARSAVNAYYAQFGNINVGDLPVQGANQFGGYAQQNGVVKTGAAGFAWRQVEIHVDQTGGVGGVPSMSWFIDGLRIGTLDTSIGAFSTTGRVTIGYMDPFASVSDNPDLSFGVIDNLTVVPEPATMLLLGAGAAYMMRRRRKA